MREFFLTDTHYPNHDPQIADIVIRLIKDVDPDIVWLGGDMVDNEAISPFLGPPQLKQTWKEAKDVAIVELTKLREAAPKAKFAYKKGNHEVWLEKYIWKHAEAFADEEALSWPKLLKLSDLDIQFYTDTNFTQIGRLWHLHGHEISSGSVFPAKGLFEKLKESLIAGHFHKFQFFGSTSVSETHGAWLIGTARNLKVPFDKLPQWQQGCAVIDYSKSGFFNVDQLIAVQDKHEKQKCIVFNGKVYYPNKTVKL